MIRLGRISYVNMAPLFFRLDAEVEQVAGVPTELNQRLLAGEIDLAPISSIAYARNAKRLRILPRVAVSSEGAVDSIQLVSRAPLSRIRSVAVTSESATSVVLVRILLPEAEHVPLEQEADAKLLIGDAALKSVFEDPTPHYDLGRLWQERTGLPMVYAVFACADPPPAAVLDLEEALLESHRLSRAEPEALAREASARYGYPPGFLARYFEKLRYGFGPRERAGLLTFFELARDAGELEVVPELRFVSGDPRAGQGPPLREPAPRAEGDRVRGIGARDGNRAGFAGEGLVGAGPVRPASEGGRSRVADVLDKALDGERISGDDALTLLRSKELVPIGKVADALRARKTHPRRVTFIVDRNVNYTNICHTDCDFCAFYRRPGDRTEGYLLPKQVIFKKIEETLAIGGTGLLMQGGHHPDLGIDYYEDLFRSIKSRYRIHLHALSPPEVHHISRRSRLTIPETLTRLRDAGLDSIPGGGGEILVDRVRQIIAPKKTKTEEWLGVMREAHRLGISTTATMMYGHVETLGERVEHMRKIRDLQDEQHGFRAFISWTFQPEGTRLAPKVTHFPTSFEYLLTQAVSRIYLDNVDHIQSSWVTQGMKVGQVALSFGADDLGSVMIEENVVSAAGTTHRASTDDFVRTIKALGKVPVQRDTLYREVKVWE